MTVKKTFLQMSPAFISLMLLLSLFFFAGIYMLYGAIIYNNMILYVVGGAWSCFMFFHMFRMCLHRAVYGEKGIKVPCDKLGKKARIQYNFFIEYKEIVEVRIIVSAKDSRNKAITAIAPSSLAPKTYFEFLLRDGKTNRLFITYFSAKQRKRMLGIINDKTGHCYQYGQLLKDKDTV